LDEDRLYSDHEGSFQGPGQDTRGSPFPDGFANEEWFGVCRLVENIAGGPDVLQPRAVYQTIKSVYTRS